MTNRLVHLYAAPGLLASLTIATPAAGQRSPLAGLDSYVQQAMRTWGVPGVAIAVVKDDSVVFLKGYGVRQVGRPERVDAQTLFAIGSNTKAFTAAAIGMMVDSGTMRWDDPVTKYLPGFQLYDPWVTRAITIRDLLSHRSGLGRRGDLLWYGSAYSRTDILQRIRYLEPNSSFRSQYGYQNIMFLAAGQALAAAAGTSWDDFIATRIFRPLGMAASNTSVADLRPGSNVATPHLIVNDTARPIPWRNIDNIAPAGAINASAGDMVQWIRLQLGNGRYAGRVLLRPETVAEMRSPQTIIPARPDTLFPSTHFTLYGLGWVLQDYRGRKLAWHTGGIDGMLSEVLLVPEEQLGLVILSNSEGHDMNPAIAFRIIDAYLDAPRTDWSALLFDRFRTDQVRQDSAERAVLARRMVGTRPSLPLDRYTGTYSDSLYGQATVALQGGRLLLRYGPALTGNMEHWNFDTFRVTWRGPRLGSAFVTFGLGASGTVERMNVEGIAEFRAMPTDASTPTAATGTR